MKKLFLLCCTLALFSFYVEAGSLRETAPVPLRVGILPDADSLPFMVAMNRGYFEQEGTQVELITFSSPLERDAAIQAGRLDGAVSDLLASAFLTAGGFDFKVTSLTDGRYGIVASPQSGIRTLAELRGKRVGLSANTIIQYTVDAQLAAAGVAMSEYEAVAVPNMPLRLEMVLSGLVDAASLPEPLLTAAVSQGAVLLSTTDTTGIDAGIMLFSKRTLDSRLDSVKAFYRAYYRAVLEINANPDSFRDFLVQEAAFPLSVRDAYRFVAYRTPSLPDVSQVRNVLDWLRARRLLDAQLVPDDMIDPRAVSEW